MLSTVLFLPVISALSKKWIEYDPFKSNWTQLHHPRLFVDLHAWNHRSQPKARRCKNAKNWFGPIQDPMREPSAVLRYCIWPINKTNDTIATYTHQPCITNRASRMLSRNYELDEHTLILPSITITYIEIIHGPYTLLRFNEVPIHPTTQLPTLHTKCFRALHCAHTWNSMYMHRFSQHFHHRYRGIIVVISHWYFNNKVDTQLCKIRYSSSMQTVQIRQHAAQLYVKSMCDSTWYSIHAWS